VGDGGDRKQLDAVVALCRDVLGPGLAGAYLHGSAVLGGLRRRSDLDVLAVATRRTTLQEKRRLVDGLFSVSGRSSLGPTRPVELTIVVASEIRPWRYPPRMDFQYGEWLRADFERGELEPGFETNRDLAPLLAMVLLGDRALVGPPPSETFDPVPRTDYVAAMVSGIDGLLADLDEDTGNVVLTLARIWCTVATDEIRAKDAAADWALPRLPEEHRAVLARARAVYLGEEGERWDDLEHRVRPHAAHVVAEIRRLVGNEPAQAS
jgi:predicted nucleotidyltransferase